MEHARTMRDVCFQIEYTHMHVIKINCLGVFLHDPRIRAIVPKAKPIRATRAENNSCKDAFYWPDMKVRPMYEMTNVCINGITFCLSVERRYFA
jgi:hypothetical protein